MAENRKELFLISDEGVIYMYYLTVDYDMLIEHIDLKSALLVFETMRAYLSLLNGISKHMDIVNDYEHRKKILRFISKEYFAQHELIDKLNKLKAK